MNDQKHSDRRAHQEKESVNGVRDLLEEAAQGALDTLDGRPIQDVLKSQGALAAIHDKGRRIQATSLNTFKRHADLYVEGGFKDIDRLRRVALETLLRRDKKAAAHRHTRSEAQAQKISELNAQLEVVREDLLLLTKLFEMSLAKWTSCATSSEDGHVIALAKKEQRELMLMYATRQLPVPGRADAPG